MTKMDIIDDFRPIIENLFDFKYRYIAYLTGRTGIAKSTNISKALLICGLLKPLRILCCRQHMTSIKDSVHAQLKDLIREYELPYEIFNDSIRAKNGTTFIFKGLLENSQDIKSLSNANICWCFPAGTLVDGKPIESIKPGEYVMSYNHETHRFESNKVLRVMRRKSPQKLYKLLTSAGLYSIIGTGNHPVYVKDKGYVELKNVKKGDIVYGCEIKSSRVRTLFGRLRTYVTNRQSEPQTEIHKVWWVSLLGLCKKIKFGKAVKGQSDEPSRDCGKNAKKYASASRETKGSWWQRSWLYHSAKDACKGTWSWLVARIGNSNGRPFSRRLPNELQGGHCEYILRDCGRSGWQFAPWRCWKSRRREKECFLTEQRVDCVEIYEQTSAEQSGCGAGTDYVYNLEVQGTHNYFANGLLVHNCEEASSISKSSWESLIPTIRAKNSFIVVSANPDQESDIVWQMFGPEAPARDDTFTCFKDFRYNPFPLEPSLLHDITLMKRNRPADYDMIYLGKLQSSTDRPVVRSWDPVLNVGVGKQSRTIYWSLDFNVNPQCSVICQWDGDHDFYFSDEIVLENASTYRVAEEFVKIYKKKYQGRSLVINGDASGRSRSSNSEYSNYAIIEQVLVKNGIPFDFQVPKANGSISNRVNNFDWHVKGLDGKPHILVNPECKHLCHACKLLSYDSKGNIIEVPARPGMKTIDYAKSHIFDAASYCVMTNDAVLENFVKQEKPKMVTLREMWERSVKEASKGITVQI